jgi:choline dehydrogenase-like flavoprotein
MGGDDSSAIVDENLKLFGTSNCYVCSAAVFPTSGFSNPTHTVIALAIRLVSKLTSK